MYIPSHNDPDIYPGHQIVSKLKVTAIGDNEQISYDLLWKGVNTLETPLEFTIYKTSENYDVVATCNKKEEKEGSLKYLSEECSISNLSSLGGAIASGTIASSTEETKTELVKGEYLTATKNGNIVYYYVVLEYPNLDEPQNYDSGGSFEGIVTGEKSDIKADINIIAAYIEQEDGTYKATNDIPVNGLFNADKSECSNNATVSWTSNGLLVSNLTKSGTSCNLYFYRDSESPVVNGYTSSVTGSTITVTVDASDNVGITKYYYVIDGGEPVEKTANTHTFEQLTTGQSYEITVYVTDGTNESNRVTKTVVAIPPAETTLAKLKVTANTGTPDFGKTSCSSGCKEATVGIYATTDETGKTSYYYRGDVTNNYLKFANKYWRIIRINGDGTIRIIYDGTSYHANGTSTTDNLINNGATYAFSKDSKIDHNTYVGFMYGSADTNATYAQTHTNTNKSNAMDQLETWYKANLLDYESLIDKKAGFCGDRRSTTNINVNTPDGTGGTGSTATYYGAYLRLENDKAPSLTCENNDLYTLKVAKGGTSGKGNNALDYPIGLITADEVALAGGSSGSDNTSYYLYNGRGYWTLSPYDFNGSDASVFNVNFEGYLLRNRMGYTIGLRPVIVLSADVTISGSGVQGDEYEVSS